MRWAEGLDKGAKSGSSQGPAGPALGFQAFTWLNTPLMSTFGLSVASEEETLAQLNSVQAWSLLADTPGHSPDFDANSTYQIMA